MPCLIGQAICFIHLFGLQLCVAMDPPNDSEPPRSIQNPVDDRENMGLVYLRLGPTVPTSESSEVYYITATNIKGTMRLKLTHKTSEALPFGNSEPGFNLPVFHCFQKCSLILMDEG
jgi:hypothetical protein